MRARSLAAAAGRALIPGLDERYWRYQRARARRATVPALLHAVHSLRELDPDRPLHAIVVPQLGADHPRWAPAQLNHMFEVAQSLREIVGDDRVTVVSASADEPPSRWHGRVVRAIAETRATHLVIQPETDPNQPDSWTWDILIDALRSSWDGVTVGITWDSWYPWLAIRLKYLGALTDRLLLADLCEPMDGFVRHGRHDVGPMTMPLSRATLALIERAVAGTEKRWQLSFIGALYDYRVSILEELERLGVDVAVNPHRPDVTRDYDESRANQPTYLEYLAGIAASELTLNFSQANTGPNEQYKIRVQEAALVGTIPLTDDRDRTRHFFLPGQFEHFGSLADIARIVKTRVNDPVQLRSDQALARERALLLATTDFWGRIDDGLRASGLRPLTGLSAPLPPQR